MKPWLSFVEVHYAECLAVVCIRCDGDVAADEMNLKEPIEDELVRTQCQTIA